MAVLPCDEIHAGRFCFGSKLDYLSGTIGFFLLLLKKQKVMWTMRITTLLDLPQICISLGKRQYK